MSLFLSAQTIANDPLAGLIIGVLVTNAVAGAIVLVGFYAVMKRFMATEFPAQITRVDSRLEKMDKHISDLATELRAMRRDVDRHEVILERRDRGGDDLDDTRGGGGRDRRRRV